jgi:DNA polymerase-3 subunit epsilon
MNPRLRLGAAIAACSLAVMGGSAAIAFTLWSTLNPEQRTFVTTSLSDNLGALIFLCLLLLTALGIVLHGLFWSYLSEPARLAEESRLILGANPSHRIVCDGPVDIARIAEAINTLAARCESQQGDTARQIAEARSDLEREKDLLAALMSQLNECVVVCNTSGHILLYNERARQLLGTAPSDHIVLGGPYLMGLGRSLFTILDLQVVAHARDYLYYRLQHGDRHPKTVFVARARGGQLLRVHMAPVTGVNVGKDKPVQVSGFVLFLEDILRQFEADAERGRLFDSFTTNTRSSLASIRAATENLMAYPEMDAGQRRQFIQIVSAEAERMTAMLENAVAENRQDAWPLTTMLGRDLLSVLQSSIKERNRTEVCISETNQPLWLKVDSFLLAQGLIHLINRLNQYCDVRSVELHLEQSGRRPQLDLRWKGAAPAVETTLAWGNEPIAIGSYHGTMTLNEIIDRHAGEIWCKHDAALQMSYFRILLGPAGEDSASSVPLFDSSRPVFYDFDLLQHSGEVRELDHCKLSELTYTAFDTETTGLDPTGGDEIISIGAVRIVNGNLRTEEVFDQLVNPRRPINPASVRVHGITSQMVEGQPYIEQVLPVFHRFCEDTVLLAHNAAFDMRFLQLKEARTGLKFTNPILDTLMLSAVLHPHQQNHTLEAIAARFGVNIFARHTALGDAIVTGEIFLRMLPLLKEMGILTLAQAREAVSRTPYAKVSY